VSGEIESTRLDVAALGLVPLKLEDRGIWTPGAHYWGEEDEPIEEWDKPIIARGPRQEFEMEQVVPGGAPDDFDSDPICKSNDLKDAGDRKAVVTKVSGDKGVASRLSTKKDRDLIVRSNKREEEVPLRCWNRSAMSASHPTTPFIRSVILRSKGTQ
jgi:hypothetical protein